MLTSPVGGAARVGRRGSAAALPRRAIARPAAALLALALAGGVLASDALQYHSSDLAPTARYQEMASLNARFAGEGPTLFTDFDEYSMYELRDLDVGGPDFVYPPPALAAPRGGYGDPVELDRVAPAALLDYPLIITRRDPAASRPPSAYRSSGRAPTTRSGNGARALPRRSSTRRCSGDAAAQCEQIRRLAPPAPLAAARRGAGERAGRRRHARRSCVSHWPGPRIRRAGATSAEGS